MSSCSCPVGDILTTSKSSCTLMINQCGVTLAIPPRDLQGVTPEDFPFAGGGLNVSFNRVALAPASVEESVPRAGKVTGGIAVARTAQLQDCPSPVSGNLAR